MRANISQRASIESHMTSRAGMSAGMSAGVGGTDNYEELENLPSINGDTVIGDMLLWQPKNFSAEEQNTGIKWTNGKDIYFKTIQYTITSSGTGLVTPDDIFDDLIFVSIIMSGDGVAMSIPYNDGSDLAIWQRYDGYIRIYTNSNWFRDNCPNVNIKLFYTKRG